MKIQEGYMPYLGYQTYYRIVGEKTDQKSPLVLLHGGPGSSHNYFEVFDQIAEETGRQVIMYDQLGCGNSYVENRPDLWNAKTWVEELIALREYLQLDEIYLLGQSWGGMLLLDYICNYPALGIKGIILSSTLPASWMWGEEQQRMIRELPIEMQNAIKEATQSGDYSSPAYQDAEQEYMRRHSSGPYTEQTPECVTRAVKKGRESYIVGWGPNEFTPLGTLKNYDVTLQLMDIVQPTLIMSGGNDLCTPYIAKYMFDHIPDAKWKLFQNCRHMCFIEETTEYLQILESWLAEHDQIFGNKGRKKIEITTFGRFQISVNGESIKFTKSKSKELLALLVDRKGTGVTRAEIEENLWEDACGEKRKNGYVQKIISAMLESLKEAGIEDIIDRKHNSISICAEKVHCDFFDFLMGNQDAIERYHGWYMIDYPWSEFTTGVLTELKLSKEKEEK